MHPEPLSSFNCACQILNPVAVKVWKRQQLDKYEQQLFDNEVDVLRFV